jgi:putative PIN family toxin of toxin-antitoxin system
MTLEKPRVIFDCMIFLQAVLSENSNAFRLFEKLEQNQFSLFISKEILDEVIDVLSREHLRIKYPQISTEIVDIFINLVLKKAIYLKSVPTKFKYSRDPKDEKYINLAIESEAQYIVSRDKDLLDLMTDISIEAKEFRQKSRPLKIVEPIEFLQILEKKDLPLKP